MSGSPQRYATGDQLRIVEDDGTSRLWSVDKRAGRGWRLEPVGGGDTRTLSDADITRMRKRIEHYPYNRAGLTPDQTLLLERTFESNGVGPCEVARRRAAYLKQVDKLHKDGMTLAEAFELAAVRVFEVHGAAWQAADQENDAEREKEQDLRRRIPKELLKNPPKPRKPLKPPQPSTIESWYHPWVAVGRDIRILVPLQAKRGNRTPRLIEDHAGIYDKMKEYIEHSFLKDKQASLNGVYKLLSEELERDGLKVSYKCLLGYLKKNYSDHEECKRRFNWRKAHMTYGVFKRQRPPAKPLDEIEIDHCLLDIIVVNEKSGRPIGRPWLTLALDRCTRMVLGVHLSFEVPSYASLQRCLAHSFWPKDLSGLDLKHPWPTEGTPRLVFCDNGKEFHSASLKVSELHMGFTVLNLPPRQPWIKGKVERIFGRIGVQVFDLEEGKTFSNVIKRGEYKSVKRANMSLTQLKQKLLKYIVDDYHVTYHEGLKGIPLEEWQRHADLDRIEGVRSYEDIRRLTGSVFHKQITNVGIKIFGLVYYHDDLKPLRRRRGGIVRKFQVRADPFDLGEVELLDEETGRWIVIPCDRPELSVGVSLHQARTNARRARRMASGAAITDDHRLAAQRAEQDEAAAALGDAGARTTAARDARYGMDNGAPFTRLVGQPEAANDPLPVPADDGAPEAVVPETGARDERTSGPRPGDADVQAEMLAMMDAWRRRSA